MVDGAQRRLGCRLGRQPAAAEGAAGEPAADPAAAARLPPAARSWLGPALVAGEPVAPPPTLPRQGPCRRRLAMAAIGGALASLRSCRRRRARPSKSARCSSWANAAMRVHDRMPVLLATDAARRWLKRGPLPTELLTPYLADAMTGWRAGDDARSSRIEPHPGMAEPISSA